MSHWGDSELTPEMVGAHRVIEPAGALPQSAERLDAHSPPTASEMALTVEALSLDATSYRQIHESCGGDPDRIARHITAIIAKAGKMHNPVTQSGGILVGRVSFLGRDFPASGLAIGAQIATGGSLTMTPLSVDAIGPVDAASPHIPASGQAIVFATAAWLPVPDDLPFRLMVACLDVYGAAPHVRDLARPGDHVIVLGAGRAGLLCLAAAQEAVGRSGKVSCIDYSSSAIARAEAAGLCDQGVVVDATDALATARALRAASVEPADLTVSLVSAPRCEVSSVLATRAGGTILYFSMATSFTRATLGAEAVCARVKMLLGSGYHPDRGKYSLELIRRNHSLWEALAEHERALS